MADLLSEEDLNEAAFRILREATRDHEDGDAERARSVDSETPSPKPEDQDEDPAAKQ